MEATQVAFGDGVVDYAVEDGIATITMNRPEYHNAQNSKMTYALDAAFRRAAHDDAVKAIVLAGAGKHSRQGTISARRAATSTNRSTAHRCGTTTSTRKAANSSMRASRVYLGMCRRWRDLPKPTIAMVQGACIAGGLMLAWVCDLIVASEDAFFADPVVRMGIPGVEYFAHAYEPTRASRRSSCSSASGCRPSARTRWGWSTVWCRASG